MQLCKKCYIPMRNIMSFSKGKCEKFYRCMKCHIETRHQRIKKEELYTRK